MQQSHCAGRTFLQRSPCTIKETAHRSVKIDDMEELQKFVFRPNRWAVLALTRRSIILALPQFHRSSLAASEDVLEYRSEIHPANASVHGRHRFLLSIYP